MKKDKNQDAFHDFMDTLARKLPDYVHNVLGIDTSRPKFACLNPNHDETDPSMHFIPDPNGLRLVKCFGCGFSGNIIQVANLVNGWPTKGPEFIKVTVRKLCEQLGLSMPEILSRVDEQDIHASWIKRIYRQALEVIREYSGNTLNQPGGDRGWTEETKREWGVATVPWNEFSQKLRSTSGATEEELAGIDVRVNMFSENGVTYTIFDHVGDPIGFSFRDARHRAGDRRYSKFVNTSGTRVPIFKKGDILYGFHKIANETSIKPELVEGYADVITAYQAGLKGFCAVNGTEVTYEVMDQLHRYGKTEIKLAFDHDPPGLAATEKAINKMAEHQGIKCFVRQPDGDENAKFDPDEWLRSKGEKAAEEWNKIDLIDGFTWTLGRHPAVQEEEQIKVVEVGISLIAAEPNNVRREHMLKRLYEHLNGDIRIEALERQLDDHVSKERAELQRRVKDIQKRAQRDAERAETPEQTAGIFSDAATKVNQLLSDKEVKKTGVNYSLSKVKDALTLFSKNDPSMPGHGTGLYSLDSKLRGLPRNELWTIAGVPNIGKSSLAVYSSYQAAKQNNNLSVLYFSTDDGAEGLIAKILAIETGFVINSITSSSGLRERERVVFDQALRHLDKLVAQGRWDIRDSREGTTIDFLENWVRETRKRYPDRDILVCVDSIHKTKSHAEGAEAKRLETMDVSKRLKKLAVSEKVGVLAVAEMNKQTDRKRPTMQGISETISVEYDSTVVIIFHQELHLDPTTSLAWEEVRQGNNGMKEVVRKPVVDLYVDKNKSIHSGWKGQMQIKFDPERCIFMDLDETDMVGSQEEDDSPDSPALIE